MTKFTFIPHNFSYTAPSFPATSPARTPAFIRMTEYLEALPPKKQKELMISLINNVIANTPFQEYFKFLNIPKLDTTRFTRPIYDNYAGNIKLSYMGDVRGKIVFSFRVTNFYSHPQGYISTTSFLIDCKFDHLGEYNVSAYSGAGGLDNYHESMDPDDYFNNIMARSMNSPQFADHIESVIQYHKKRLQTKLDHLLLFNL